MNITKRLFAYPVLSDEKDDYIQSVFQVDYKTKMEDVNTLRLTFSIEMTCEEINDLIVSGDAEFVIHLECSKTAYRKIKKSISKNFFIDIPIDQINGTLELVALIILKEDVESFVCSDWSEDFEGMTFSLEHSSIIGYQNLSEINISKDYEEFANSNSIFTVYKKYKDEKYFDIDLEHEKIKIGLPVNDYELYGKYSGNKDCQAVLNAMLVLPAMVYIFEELKQDYGEELYHNREWYIALEKSYNKRGLNFLDEVTRTDKTSIELAQEAMEYPVSSALIDIGKLLIFDEEEAQE